MLTAVINKLAQGIDLTEQESFRAMEDMLLSDNVPQITALLCLLKAKGETVEELLGIIHCMRTTMQTVELDYPTLDIVGTGGDGSNTVNISTASAILAAACGVKIVKHGNRAVSSLCGSADFLEAFSVNIDLDAKSIADNVNKTGFGFCFAPAFHPPLAKLKLIRKQLVIPTCFNLVGPLLNPAQAEYLMLGVADAERLELFATLVKRLGVKRAMIFHCQGTDEICSLGEIQVAELVKGEINCFVVEPQRYGFKSCSLEDLRGGDGAHNATLLLKTFKGNSGPIADTLILNAGMAIYLYGLRSSIEQGIILAREALGNAKAYEKLNEIITLTNQFPAKNVAEVQHV